MTYMQLVCALYSSASGAAANAASLSSTVGAPRGTSAYFSHLLKKSSFAADGVISTPGFPTRGNKVKLSDALRILALTCSRTCR